MHADLPSDAAWERCLALSGATLSPGLSAAELADVEGRFGFVFPPDLRQMLGLALPLGEPSWPDWRSGTAEDLARRIAWPIDGILFDVEENAFWYPSWPSRPSTKAAAVDLARHALSKVAPLVPVFGHRYLPTLPCSTGNPVLSVYQTDIIYYGSTLLTWFEREFRQQADDAEPRRVPFWSDFLEADSGDSHQFW